MRLQLTCLACCLLAFLSLQGASADAQTDSPPRNGQGHALLFQDQTALRFNFNDFPTSELTFEAWMSVSDYCHSGAVMSYALDSRSTNATQRVTDFNHFVIFDPHNLLACHSYQYIDLIPDIQRESCHAAYNATETAGFVERTGEWHHLAVTWSSEDQGRIIIYKDGLRMAEALTGHVDPIQPGGAFMLGGEQDCFGGCVSAHQAFYGLMDEVRLWKTVRTSEEILSNMRRSDDLEITKDLVGFWKFDEPSHGGMADHVIAKDSSGHGNDLWLAVTPKPSTADIGSDKRDSVLFNNNFLIAHDLPNMPDKDFTIEFWAKADALAEPGTGELEPEKFSQFISYSSFLPGKEDPGLAHASWTFVDDAINIGRYLANDPTRLRLFSDGKTMGSVSVRVNANRQGMGSQNDNWLDFDTQWTDGEWHHLAVTWAFDTGETHLYLDGQEKLPFWRSQGGMVEDRAVSVGGVGNTIAQGMVRDVKGALVLGQKQECYAGCFAPELALDGEMAELRIWNKVRSAEDIQATMHKSVRDGDYDRSGLLHAYAMELQEDSGVADTVTNENQAMLMPGYNPPTYVPSDAPLATATGEPLIQPYGTNFALQLHDSQVVILPEFHDFPSKTITVEFWMLSSDTCRKGVPFSYAHGDYESQDNSFLIFNYNSWGIAVMEDEGRFGDHGAGFSSTDGAWHHIAVTWDSDSGKALLYDNGRLMWNVRRSKSVSIPSGGTLVIGREQDCQGGCFDSSTGAAGKVQSVSDLEYGPQDFYGAIDEMRVWNRVLSHDELMSNFKWEEGLSEDRNPDGVSVDPNSDGLVAYWTFDEGSGYRVKDVTGHGHDLIITKKPRWVRVEKQVQCGNGKLEGWEGCDDGNTDNGDGCSDACQVESGWKCTQTSPSICSRGALPESAGRASSPAERARQREEGTSRSALDSGSSSRSGSDPAVPGGTASTRAMWVLWVVLATVAIICGVAAIMFREHVYDRFPMVESAVHSSAAFIHRLRPSGRSGFQQVDADARSDFSFAARPAGRRGPMSETGRYAQLPGSEAAGANMTRAVSGAKDVEDAGSADEMLGP